MQTIEPHPVRPAAFRRPKFPAAAVVACLVTAWSAPRPAAAAPNIIVIVADDVAWHDLHVQGAADLLTDRIDSLATGGVRFLNAYATAPVCSPSRAGLLTGRWQQRFGHETNPGESLEHNAGFGLPLTESTMGDRLRSLGYATAWIGKSHLGAAAEEPALSVYHPLRRGFDRFFGFLGSHRTYYDDPLIAGPDPLEPIWDDDEKVHEPEYLTKAFGREILEFIDARTDAAPDEPFFIYAPFSAAHFDTNRELTWPPDTVARLPDGGFTSTKRRDFARVLLALDDAVGAILDKLEERGLEQNTLIMFTSDNGGDLLFGGVNAPLGGRKTEVYEGGVRVPLLMRWKDHLPEGVTRSGLVSLLDVLPTAVAAAGATVPAAWQLDGANLLPYARGLTADSPHDALYWRVETNGVNESVAGVKDGLRAIRQGPWKLVKPAVESPWELYDLGKDEGEETNVATENPAKVAELAALWEAWNAGLARPRWAVDDLAWAAPVFIRDDIRIGDPVVSMVDPQFRPDGFEASWQDGIGALWRGAVDPEYGWLVTGSGRDVPVDAGLASLVDSGIGAQWGLTTAGTALYYTKGGGAAPLRVWRAGPGNAPPVEFSASAAADVSAPRPAQDPAAGAGRFLARVEPGAGGESARWAPDSSPAAGTELPWHAGGERNGVWIPGTSAIVYVGFPQGLAGTPQILRYQTDRGTVEVITTDLGAKAEACVFHAPELNGELCYAAIVDRTAVAVYGDARPGVGGGRSRLATLALPPAAPPRFFHGLRPLGDAQGWNGTSWMTVGAYANSNPLTPGESEVLALSLGPDEAHRTVRRLDAEQLGVVSDAKTFAGTREVFCWYSRVQNPAMVQLHRARTGLVLPDRQGEPTGFTSLEIESEIQAGPTTLPAVRATETTALVSHQGWLFAGVGSTTRLPGDGLGPWTGAQILVKTSADAPWTVDGDFAAHLTVAALAAVPVTVTGAGVALPAPSTLLLASLQDIGAPGSAILSVRTRMPSGGWEDSHIANPAGDAAYPTAFASHSRTLPGGVVERIFAGLSTGRIHRGQLDPAADGLLTWDPAAELSGTGPVRGFASAGGRLYALCDLRQEAADQPVTGGLYVRDDLTASWSLVYQPAGMNAVFAASPEDRALLGVTAVPDPRGDDHEVLLLAHPWTGAVERIDPQADHASSVELDVRDFLARRWHDDSVRQAAVAMAFTGFAAATDPVTEEGVALAGVSLHRDGQTQPAMLIRHRDGTWEEAGFALGGGAVPWRHAAVRTVAASPFAEEAGTALYIGGGLPESGRPDSAWINRGAWTKWPSLTFARLGSDAIELAWPTTGDGWSLQTSVELEAGSWADVPDRPVRGTATTTVVMPAAEQRAYFRLTRP